MGKDQRSRRKSGTEQRVFRAESFFTTKEWVYFCLEYDLEICDGCRARARRRKTSAPAAGPIPWFCEGCTPPRRRPPRAMNGELWEAIRSRTNVRGRCELCEQQISFKECWVSDDCRRLYCSRHLRRLATPDRFRLARRHLRRWSRLRNPQPLGLTERISSLEKHLKTSRCGSCRFNGQGIYDGARLVEIDTTERACNCAPDTLNCAGLEG